MLKQYILLSDSGEIIGRYMTSGGAPEGSLEIGKDVIVNEKEFSNLLQGSGP